MEFPFITDILNFFQSVWDWVYVGIYEFTKSAFVLLTKYCIQAYLSGMIFVAEVGYEVFTELMKDVGVTQYVQSNYASLDVKLRSALSFFGIPEAVNMIVSAIGTRFSMRFIPLIGG